jgi:carboxylesterase type B
MNVIPDYRGSVPGPGCPQQCVLPPHTCPARLSEDCLYLNIYTPRVQAQPGQLLPVMFFMPGGRYEQGDAGSSMYSGAFMANHTSTILVTTNYRLGALGFLVTDSLPGNYGLQVRTHWLYKPLMLNDCKQPGPTPFVDVGSQQYTSVWRRS